MSQLILLADDKPERGNVLAVFLDSLGFQVVRCSTVREVMEHLAKRGPRPAMMLASVRLHDGELLPALEQWFCEQMHPLPRLMLWSQFGEVDLPEHEPFFEHMHALVLPLPLDIDLMLRVVRLLSDRPEALRPPSPARSCPAMARHGRHGRKCCVRAGECQRKES